jgi:hypothetical protein
MTQVFTFNDIPDGSMADAASELFELTQQEPDNQVGVDIGDGIVAYFVCSPVEGEEDQYNFSEYLLVGEANPARLDEDPDEEPSDSAEVVGRMEQRLHFLREAI